MKVRQPVAPLEFIAGNLRFFLEEWQKITSDFEILQTVRGIKLDLMEIPFQTNIPRQYRFNENLEDELDSQINELLGRNIIQKIKKSEAKFISNVFLRPKSNGKMRMIIDLSKLNDNIDKKHFKMEHLDVAMNLIQPGYWLASIDLKDAYYSVYVSPQHQNYLSFQWKGEVFKFLAMPFGLTSAPRIFTKLMKPVYSILHEEGFQGFGFIDDSFLIAQTENKCLEAIQFLVNLLQRLGFYINFEKSSLKPSVEMVFLGYKLNTQEMTVKPTEEKITKATGKINNLLQSNKLKIRDVASVLGLLNDMCKGVEYGPNYLKFLEIDKIEALKNAGKKQFEGKMSISDRAKNELLWWRENLHRSVRNIRTTCPDIWLHTDASTTGWGAVCEQGSKGGIWSEEEKSQHINILELMAVMEGLMHYFNTFSEVQIKVSIDNTTAIAYLKHMGGTKSEKCMLMAKRIWNWCEQRRIWLVPCHIPGVENVMADRESRQISENTEWQLSQEIFQIIVNKWGRPDIDLFATAETTKCKHYVSWLPDKNATCIDAFCIKWNVFNMPYIFPPFRLLPKCLQKIKSENAHAIVIIPTWKGQPWYAMFQELTRETITFLPREGNLYTRMETKGCGLQKIGLTAGLC